MKFTSTQSIVAGTTKNWISKMPSVQSRPRCWSKHLLRPPLVSGASANSDGVWSWQTGERACGLDLPQEWHYEALWSISPCPNSIRSRLEEFSDSLSWFPLISFSISTLRPRPCSLRNTKEIKGKHESESEYCSKRAIIEFGHGDIDLSTS